MSWSHVQRRPLVTYTARCAMQLHRRHHTDGPPSRFHMYNRIMCVRNTHAHARPAAAPTFPMCVGVHRARAAAAPRGTQRTRTRVSQHRIRAQPAPATHAGWQAKCVASCRAPLRSTNARSDPLPASLARRPRCPQSTPSHTHTPSRLPQPAHASYGLSPRPSSSSLSFTYSSSCLTCHRGRPSRRASGRPPRAAASQS